MGQYYHAIILEEDKKTIKAFGAPHSCNNGAKLMEHSYLNNNLCQSIMQYIYENGPCRVVWAGDYADPEKETITDEEIRKIWMLDVANGLTDSGLAEYAAHQSGEIARRNATSEGRTLYDLCNDVPDREIEYFAFDGEQDNIRFLINEDKKEFVDLWYLPRISPIVHPLPLLTCEGNGRGGGDYDGLDMELVGTWARDSIRVSNTAPDLDTFKEIKPQFLEFFMIRDAMDDIRKLLPKYKEAKLAYDPMWKLKDDDYYGGANSFTDFYEELKEFMNGIK